MHESAKSCSAALGQSRADLLNPAAQAAGRRRNATAYLAWEASRQNGQAFDTLDAASTALSLHGAEW